MRPIIGYYPLGGFTGTGEEAVYVISGDTASVKGTLEKIVVYKQPPRSSFTQNEHINIVVFRGVFRTGGYGISISEVLLDDNTFIVRAVYSEPGSGMIVTQAFTQPTAIIPIGKLEKGSYLVRLLVTRKVITHVGEEKLGEEQEHEITAFTVTEG